MTPYLLVFFGAGLGGALRHGVNLTCARWCGLEFPWGTLTINILGSTLMGLAAGWFAFKAGESWSQHARLFATTGVLGGFTTFSAFSLETALMIERRAYGTAAGYAGASVLLSITALFVGLIVARRVFA